jgi:hypothetical protein
VLPANRDLYDTPPLYQVNACRLQSCSQGTYWYGVRFRLSVACTGCAQMG